jgi:hypothetical protein
MDEQAITRRRSVEPGGDMDLASMPLFGEEDNCEQQQRSEPAVIASRWRRSPGVELEGELLSILTEAAYEAPPAERLEPLRLHMAKGVTQGAWRREDLYGDDGR